MIRRPAGSPLASRDPRGPQLARRWKSEGSYNFRPILITHMSSSVPTMPEWVTALEAAVLTGASETEVLEAVAPVASPPRRSASGEAGTAS